jgi:hypothetical protein
VRSWRFWSRIIQTDPLFRGIPDRQMYTHQTPSKNRQASNPPISSTRSSTPFLPSTGSQTKVQIQVQLPTPFSSPLSSPLLSSPAKPHLPSPLSLTIRPQRQVRHHQGTDFPSRLCLRPPHISCHHITSHHKNKLRATRVHVGCTTCLCA